MNEQKKKNNFVLQAGILAASGMIVKVIGLIYRSPLLSIIGLEGNDITLRRSISIPLFC